MTRSLVVLVTLGIAIGGCSRDRPAEGPTERAGEKVDRAAEEMEETTEEAADETGEALEEAGDEAEDITQDED